MTDQLGWFERLEAARKRNRFSVDKLLGQLQMSRATYYDYKAHPDRRPRSKSTIAKIAEFLGEDMAALSVEMAHVSGPPPTAFLEAAAARDLNTRLYQQHVLALAHLLGMAGSSPRAQGVDVAVRILRELLTQANSGCPESPVVAVASIGRGLDRRESVYQHQIYVLPKDLAGFADVSEPSTSVAEVSARVNEVMNGVMLPVTREHSTELALPIFRGKADVLLYPGLLEMRPPEPLAPWPTEDATLLVTGVYYAGAPDVAALLARELQYGFSTFDQMARLQARAGLRGLPSAAFKRSVAGVAHAVLGDQSPTAGPMVWATDDPEPLLTPVARADVANFPDPVVMLTLTDEVLDYAAYRIGCVESSHPSPEDQAENRRWLDSQQEELLALVKGRGHARRTIIRSIDLPPQARRRADGVYPDAVDAMFDRYVGVASSIAEELRLESVIAAQIDRLDRRVAGGKGVYAAEQEEIREARQQVARLRAALQLGRFLGPVGYLKAKPQFLLLFDSPRGPVVLKVYGRLRPGEALVQRLWRRAGVCVVNVLDSGDMPTSWLVMAPFAIEHRPPPELSAGQLLDTTNELAVQMAQAHQVGRTELALTPDIHAKLQRLDLAIGKHLGKVLVSLSLHGYPVPEDWQKTVQELCVSTHPTLLHGDLGGGNVVRDVDSGQLWILDACGYIGPAEFDAARWAARNGGTRSGEALLAAWLDADSGLDVSQARGLLGLELLMEAGVREIVKDEQRQPLNFPDPITEQLLKSASQLIRAKIASVPLERN
ncbi:transcriptional regulator with XRE-family HTH domain [Micromonospora jinlongensis]|uniref:Transcriptional regulator with XRE-family HTH domain n=1 Tax=Micromonospora jinlongensis TaxID=1287877 RepID=A0A7Z0BC07_9ACTN|nr:hypothetical protein [Micromonospora jinlongensis]NYH40330.1 transcriptional regulator with XRE-family HTH domain [Micromonospora jinlongensis]